MVGWSPVILRVISKSSAFRFILVNLYITTEPIPSLYWKSTKPQSAGLICTVAKMVSIRLTTEKKRKSLKHFHCVLLKILLLTLIWSRVVSIKQACSPILSVLQLFFSVLILALPTWRVYIMKIVDLWEIIQEGFCLFSLRDKQGESKG